MGVMKIADEPGEESVSNPQLSFQDSKKPKSKIVKTRSPKNVELTQRDLEILEFILEMKFASVEIVFLKFFKITKSNEAAKSQAWAKKRLQQLEHAKFLRAVYSFSERTRYYTGTFKSFYALAQVTNSEVLPKPMGAFDQRTFHHDRALLDLRQELESSGQSISWISDRQLRSKPELVAGLTGNNVPDSIYTTPALEKVALELEIAQKGKEKYREKIRRYLSILRSQETQKPFSKVRFICAKENVRKILDNETKFYPEYFVTEGLVIKSK